VGPGPNEWFKPGPGRERKIVAVRRSKIRQLDLAAALGGALDGAGDHRGAFQIVGGAAVGFAVLPNRLDELRQQRVLAAAAGAIRKDLPIRHGLTPWAV
jgi:hypothetical protein